MQKLKRQETVTRDRITLVAWLEQLYTDLSEGGTNPADTHVGQFVGRNFHDCEAAEYIWQTTREKGYWNTFGGNVKR